MGLAEWERRKDEKIDGVIYDMSPAPGYQHGVINSNIHVMIKQRLKGSVCLVSIENLDFKYHPEENGHMVKNIRSLRTKCYAVGS